MTVPNQSGLSLPRDPEKPQRKQSRSPLPRNILVCVAWPYVNNAPHLGHIAGMNMPADIFARYHRLAGNNVGMVS